MNRQPSHTHTQERDSRSSSGKGDDDDDDDEEKDHLQLNGRGSKRETSIEGENLVHLIISARFLSSAS
jgi:hypothetical protein